MKFYFRAFKAVGNRDLCEKYLDGHVKVLLNYGITNITSNTRDWMEWESMYCVIAEDEEGTMVGGIRVQISDGSRQLPVERAIGRMDPRIHDIVRSYADEGFG